MNYLWIIAAAGLIGGLLYYGESRRERTMAMAQERVALIDRVRNGRGYAVFSRMRENARLDVLPLMQARDRYAHREQHLTDVQKDWAARAWKGKPPTVGLVIVASVLSVAWLVLFLLQRYMDIEILNALGYIGPLGQVLGTAAAIVFAVLGILVSGLFELHELPYVAQLRRSIRVTAAILLVGGAFVLFSQLTHVAQYRARSTIGPQLSQAQKTLAQVQFSQPVDPVELAVAQRNVDDLQARLSTAERLDRTLIEIVPPAEMLLAAAPVMAAEVFAIFAVGYAARNAGHKRQRYVNQIAVREQTLVRDATTLADDADLDPGDVESWTQGTATLPGLSPTPRVIDVEPIGAYDVVEDQPSNRDTMTAPSPESATFGGAQPKPPAGEASQPPDETAPSPMGPNPFSEF